MASVVKDGSEPEAEPEEKPVENEENGEADEEVREFFVTCVYRSCGYVYELAAVRDLFVLTYQYLLYLFSSS